jgi:murein DD-endopeptidase MepM/ murein hydrolase activator NlpD
VHRGIDALAPLLSSVYAADQGRVTKVGEDAVSGRYVIIEHANSQGKVVSWTAYMHLCEISVEQNQQVTGGQKIGQSGDTGNAAGEEEHLHFEIRTSRRGGWLDAVEYFSPK